MPRRAGVQYKKFAIILRLPVGFVNEKLRSGFSQSFSPGFAFVKPGLWFYLKRLAGADDQVLADILGIAVGHGHGFHSRVVPFLGVGAAQLALDLVVTVGGAALAYEIHDVVAVLGLDDTGVAALTACVEAQSLKLDTIWPG